MKRLKRTLRISSQILPYPAKVLSSHPRVVEDATDATSHQKPCYRCGGAHLPATCKCKDWDCLICKKKGHIAKVCRHKKPCQKPYPKSHFVSEKERTTQDRSYDMFNTIDSSTEPIIVSVSLNQVPRNMELDTGASLSVINKDTYNQINALITTPITQSSVKLKTYMGECIPIIGNINVHVKYEELSVFMVDGNGPNLLGRDWLSKVKVNLGEIFSLGTPNALKEVLEKHSAVFTEQLECLKVDKVQLNVNSEACPKFFKYNLY